MVLEPEEPLRTARRAVYAGLAALADALAALAPPEKAIEFVWPGTIEIDGGVAGGGQLAWPDTPENEPPPWLVFGGMIRTVSMAEGDPGLRPLSAALEDEGFDDFGSARLVESFARHLMVQVDGWQDEGFAAVARDYLPRLKPEKGVSRSIDDNGDLLVRRVGKAEVERRKLVPVLQAPPAWLDPKTGGRSDGSSLARDTRAMKLLRTIRLDPSDTFIFANAAEPGEWAVSGAFVFSDADPGKLEGKARSAFRGGFLGVQSLGWSTLVQIVEASEQDRLAAIDALAKQLVAHFGAPGIDEAVAAAEDEFAFIESLCNQPADTLIAVHRSFEDGEIREAFRTLRPKDGPKPLRAFAFLEVEGEDEPEEKVDLTNAWER